MQAHSYCEDHPIWEPEPGCPFCDDRAAYFRYRAFAEQHGVTFRDSWRDSAEVMSIYDIRRTNT
jgi:hypothetical protein